MSFYQKEDSAVFRVRQWLGGIKFWIVCGIIRALGYPALAKKVWAGWQVRPDLASLAPSLCLFRLPCSIFTKAVLGNRLERNLMRAVAAEPRDHAVLALVHFAAPKASAILLQSALTLFSWLTTNGQMQITSLHVTVHFQSHRAEVPMVRMLAVIGHVCNC